MMKEMLTNNLKIVNYFEELIKEYNCNRKEF